MSPALKVEIEWVSGSGTFADVSADLLKPANVTITRGRTGSDRKISGGTMTLTLRNDSGQYTPELNVDVRRGKRIRLSAFINGAWKVRFTGYVNQWSVGNIRVGAGSQCTLACIDGQAFFSAPMGQTAREVLESYGCVAYWPLTETVGTVFSDVMGKGFPNLQARRLSTGGTLDAGQGAALPTDPSGVLKFNPATALSGWYLESMSTVDFGSEWTLGCWVDGFATADYSSSLTVQQGNKYAQLIVTSGGGSYAAEEYHDASYSNYWSPSGPRVLGDIAPGPGTFMISLSTTRLRVHPDVDEDAPARVSWAAPYSASMLRVGWADYRLSRLTNGGMGHVFVIPSALTHAQMAALANLLQAAAADAAVRLGQWYQWAGEPQTVVTLGTAPATVQPATDGQTPADLAQTAAEGLAARTLFSRDGQPLWIGADYRPTPVTIQPGWIDADSFQFATTPDQYISKVDATLPSGGTYTYAKDNPEIRNPESITGVAADDALTQAVAQWIANSADGGARAPQLTIHLDRRTAAEQATIADLDIASRMTLASLPSTLPSSLAVVGEGYTETFGDTWDMAWNLSQDVALFVWDESNWDDGPVWGI